MSLTGVKRETIEELEFANYNLFEDPKETFAIFNFNFDKTKFHRLTNLMEFSVKNNADVILERSHTGSRPVSHQGTVVF